MQYASDELKVDQEFILKAIKQNVNALQYISNDLISNKEFILAAIKQNEKALKYSSYNLLSNANKLFLESNLSSNLSIVYSNFK